MPKLRVLANLELSIELPEGTDTEEAIRLKERKLLRLLRNLAKEDGAGELEALELESFTYANEFEAEPTGYYYNKHDRRVGL